MPGKGEHGPLRPSQLGQGRQTVAGRARPRAKGPSKTGEEFGLDPKATVVCRYFLPFHRLLCRAVGYFLCCGDPDLKDACD